MAGRLDAFFADVSRCSRVPAGRIAVETAQALFERATTLLGQHPNRATEIALSVQRLRPLVLDAALVEPFAASFGQSVCERLPTLSERFSRDQARDVLVSYVILRDLGAKSEVLGRLSTLVVDASPLLEPSARAAALAKVGSNRDLVVALQRPFADLDVVATLSPPDLLAAGTGIASAAEVVPAVAVAVSTALCTRLADMRPLAVCQAVRVVGELRARVRNATPFDALLAQAWPFLMSAAEACLGAGVASAEAAPGLHSLATIGSALPAGPLRNGFVAAVLEPSVPLIFDLVREDVRASMLALPVMHLVGKEQMTELVKHLALEGLPSLSPGAAGAGCLADILKIVEDTVGDAGVAAPLFPPFFDFALEEVLRRLDDLPSAYLASLVRLFSIAHLERPEYLSDAGVLFASVVLKTADKVAPETAIPDLNNVALLVSSLSSLFMRIEQTSTGGDSAAPSDALKLLLSALLSKGRAFEEMLSSSVAGNLNSSTGPACLVLSAYVQVLRRMPSAGPASPQHLLTMAGRSLLEVAAGAWAEGVSMAPAQTHVFLIAVRLLFVRAGMPPPAPSVAAFLRSLLEQSLSVAATDREARLCLAMLGELSTDPLCPDALRASLAPLASLGAPDQRALAPLASDRSSQSPASRLKDFVQNKTLKGASEVVDASPKPLVQNTPSQGLWRRIFG